MSNTALIIVGIIFAAVLGSLLAILTVLKKKQDKEDRINKQVRGTKSNKNHLFVAYKVFTTVPLLKGYFSKVMKTVASLYPADHISIQIKATKLMLKNIGISLAIFIVCLFASNGDTFYICAGALCSLVLTDYLVSNKLIRMERQLLGQLKDFVSDIRHYYMASGSVVDAIGDTLDDIPFEISLHIQKLHDILSSTNMDQKLEEYRQDNPGRFFLLLSSVCAVTQEYGDGENKKKDSKSTFLNSLAYLKEEVNTELIKQTRNEYEFSGLEMMSLLPVFFIKPIEAWSINNMPDLDNFYTGIYGRAALIAISVLCYLGYKLVQILKESRRQELKNVSIWNRILGRIPALEKLTNKVVNKYYTRMMKLNDQMKEIGDQTGPQAFILKSAVVGIATFFIVILMFASGIISERITTLNTFVGNFDSAIVPNDTYLQIMQETTNDYANLYKRNNIRELKAEDIAENIRENTNLKNEALSVAVAEEILNGLSTYHSIYFRWWYLVLAFVGLGVGSLVPYLMMLFKIRVESMNKDDEINQFQTLALILMYTDGITLDTILEWMDRFAYSFKASIQECIVNLEAGETTALQTMKNSETYPAFKRFCDYLLEIDNVGVVDAFDEIESDRAYNLKEREQQNLINTERRASRARFIAMAPLLAEFALYLLGPMLILAVRMFLAMDFSM